MVKVKTLNRGNLLAKRYGGIVNSWEIAVWPNLPPKIR
jgi:hypothetical protein